MDFRLNSLYLYDMSHCLTEFKINPAFVRSGIVHSDTRYDKLGRISFVTEKWSGAKFWILRPMFWIHITCIKTINWLRIWIFVPKNETRFIIRSLRGRDVTWQVGRSWHYWINNFRICKANDDRKKTGGKSQEKNHHFFLFLAENVVHRSITSWM